MSHQKEVLNAGNVNYKPSQACFSPLPLQFPSNSFCSQNQNTFFFNLFSNMKRNSYSYLNFYLFEKPSKNGLYLKTFTVRKRTAKQNNLKVSLGLREGVKAGCSKTTRRSISPSQMHYIRGVGSLFLKTESKE